MLQPPTQRSQSTVFRFHTRRSGSLSAVTRTSCRAVNRTTTGVSRGPVTPAKSSTSFTTSRAADQKSRGLDAKPRKENAAEEASRQGGSWVMNATETASTPTHGRDGCRGRLDLEGDMKPITSTYVERRGAGLRPENAVFGHLLCIVTAIDDT